MSLTPRDARRSVGEAHRIVVKVGSSSLTRTDGGLDVGRVEALVKVVSDRVASGSHVVLVSSGAIATGFPLLGLTGRPRDLATQQASASVGQGVLLAQYSRAFSDQGLTVGQVLLTADDMTRRTHYRNAQRTFERLLEMGVVPIVNENDTVATDEIRLGDNDRLAALVAHLVRADALVLLSDVYGLYDGGALVQTIVREATPGGREILGGLEPDARRLLLSSFVGGAATAPMSARQSTPIASGPAAMATSSR